MKKEAVIFVPVGIPVYTYESEYDKDNHWRFVKDYKRFDVVAYSYKDNFEPEAGTYDMLVPGMKGFKWDLARHFMENFDYSDYDYVAFFDDDVITDIQSIHRALDIAKENDFKLFQLSTLDGSEHTHQILFQNKELQYSVTNFIEGMGPFFHSSLVPTLLEFWNFHQVKSGYGFDLLYTEIVQQKAGVIHEVSMFHPPKSFYGYQPSYYDVSEAEAEMYHILTDVYPKFMKYKYDMNVGPFQRQYIIYNYKFLDPNKNILTYKTS